MSNSLTVPLLIQQLAAFHVEAPRIKILAGNTDSLVASVAAEAGRHYPEKYGADGSRWLKIATCDAWWFERGYVAGLRSSEAHRGANAAYEAGYAIGTSHAMDPFPPSAAEVNPQMPVEVRSKMKLVYVTVPQCYGYGAQKYRLPAGARVTDVGSDAVDPSRRRVIWGGTLWLVNEPERNLCATTDALVSLDTPTPESLVCTSVLAVSPEANETLASYRVRVWQHVMRTPHEAWAARFAGASPCDIDSWCRAGETIAIWLHAVSHAYTVQQLIRMRYEALVLR